MELPTKTSTTTTVTVSATGLDGAMDAKTKVRQLVRRPFGLLGRHGSVLTMPPRLFLLILQQSEVQRIPLLKTRAGPRDEGWLTRLAEEYNALIKVRRCLVSGSNARRLCYRHCRQWFQLGPTAQYIQNNKESDSDWFKISSDPSGLKCDHAGIILFPRSCADAGMALSVGCRSIQVDGGVLVRP